jgi:hypothetical protein
MGPRMYFHQSNRGGRSSYLAYEVEADRYVLVVFDKNKEIENFELIAVSNPCMAVLSKLSDHGVLERADVYRAWRLIDAARHAPGGRLESVVEKIQELRSFLISYPIEESARGPGFGV